MGRVCFFAVLSFLKEFMMPFTTIGSAKCSLPFTCRYRYSCERFYDILSIGSALIDYDRTTELLFCGHVASSAFACKPLERLIMIASVTHNLFAVCDEAFDGS